MSFIFDANEDPKQRELRRGQAVMGALKAGATAQPTDLGSGIAAVGNALAYRAMLNKQQAAAADPWTGLRQTTGGGMSPVAMLKGLFGVGR